jgi:2-polyprenyl-6-methoxyphenol hydroxylase-like FAD-dependent oxidoreductase
MLTQCFKYGKRLKQVSSDGKQATATFEDGTTATGDLLVGTEGAHSIVREYLLGPEKAALQPSPIVASASMAKLPAEAALKYKEIGHRALITFAPFDENRCLFGWIGSMYFRP